MHNITGYLLLLLFLLLFLLLHLIPFLLLLLLLLRLLLHLTSKLYSHGLVQLPEKQNVRMLLNVVFVLTFLLTHYCCLRFSKKPFVIFLGTLIRYRLQY